MVTTRFPSSLLAAAPNVTTLSGFTKDEQEPGLCGHRVSSHWLSPLSLHFVLPLGVEDVDAAPLGLWELTWFVQNGTCVSLAVSVQKEHLRSLGK